MGRPVIWLRELVSKFRIFYGVRLFSRVRNLRVRSFGRQFFVYDWRW